MVRERKEGGCEERKREGRRGKVKGEEWKKEERCV
jgi:hypothetical protein